MSNLPNRDQSSREDLIRALCDARELERQGVSTKATQRAAKEALTGKKSSGGWKS